ncbi:MAG: carbamoyltransferase HypF [Candidatus Hodarchaeales archaeon]|jgi:hydrogenase maturation protein HypF
MQDSREILLKGRIQGIGFRPFVYRIAVDAGVKGWVQNIGNGVRILVQGSSNEVKLFLELLKAEKPPLAVYDAMSITESSNHSLNKEFSIIKSSNFLGSAASYIPPDLAICDNCLNEMNRGDRPGRAGYPFTSCVDCGPRYTVIRKLPYDRPFTEMDRFPLCKECSREYTNPGDRRYHAQTTCCRACGPNYSLYSNYGEKVTISEHEIPGKVMNLIVSGKIVAIKGIGGCHLACNPYDDESVLQLRDRKGDRKRKPFALMSRDIKALERHAWLTAEEQDLLSSFRRPIVLLERKSTSSLSKHVAPDLYNIGWMLPYAGIHYLLFQYASSDLDCLVMTSGNTSHQPIIVDNDRIMSELSGIADYFLLHDRDIYQRADDSVIKSMRLNSDSTSFYFIRRSRGWVPEPLKLPVDFKQARILACGPEMHNVPAVSLEGMIFPGQYNGDIKYASNFEFYQQTINHLLSLFGMNINDLDAIACDLHPDYTSTRHALELGEETGLSIHQIQHHHAHACSVMVEHGLTTDEETIAVILDGTGYGADGHVWGGEILRCRYDSFERLAHLEEVLMPGGDKCVDWPARMLSSYLSCDPEIELPDWINTKIIQGLPRGKGELEIIRKQLQTGFNCIPTTSTGRFLDSISFLLGFNRQRSYEGEPAIVLESAGIHGKMNEKNPLVLETSGNSSSTRVIRTTRIFKQVIELLETGEKPQKIAYWIQEALAKTLFSTALAFVDDDPRVPLVLSGGVAYNTLISGYFARFFKKNRKIHRFLTNRELPPGDGGISTGQTAVAMNSRI